MGDVRPLTNQEILSRIYSEFVLNEKEQCLGLVTVGKDTAECCMYRNKKGNQCFIGYFIPEHEYSPNLEAKGMSSKGERDCFFRLAPETKARLDDGTESRMRFLAKLQKIHDGGGPQAWYSELRALAAKYGLEMKPAR